jgi:hypothetical protein
MSGWIGVDLDGTLAEYHGWLGAEDIGKPIPAMVERVQQWIKDGKQVRIVTARVALSNSERTIAACAVYNWCNTHLGFELPVTSEKDFAMIELWDDRCVHVETNTGRVLG